MNKQEIIRIFADLRKSFDEAADRAADALTATDILPKAEYINDLYNWDELQALAQSGKAAEKIAIGDRLEVYRSGKQIIFDVVKVTDSKIYLLSHYLIAQMPFDAPEPKNPDADIACYGSNNYLGSSIRQWLNSSRLNGDWWEKKTEYDKPIGCKDFLNGFMLGMDDWFIDILLSDENGDKFFLPSEDEIEEWLPNKEGRIKTYKSGEKDWYWIRTPGSGYSGYVRCVVTSGTLNYNYAYNASGVAPACIIGNL